jgi:hypothetical protein
MQGNYSTPNHGLRWKKKLIRSNKVDDIVTIHSHNKIITDIEASTTPLGQDSGQEINEANSSINTVTAMIDSIGAYDQPSRLYDSASKRSRPACLNEPSLTFNVQQEPAQQSQQDMVIMYIQNGYGDSNGKSSTISRIVNDLSSSKGDKDLSSEHPEAIHNVEVNENVHVSQQDQYQSLNVTNMEKGFKSMSTRVEAINSTKRAHKAHYNFQHFWLDEDCYESSWTKSWLKIIPQEASIVNVIDIQNLHIM